MLLLRYTNLCVLYQPAGLSKSSLDKGASAKKEDLSSARNGEKKPGNC